MREIVELRVFEPQARRFLDDAEGERLGSTVRKVSVDTQSPTFSRLGEIDRELRKTGKHLFGGWQVHRKYSPAELRAAELLRLWLPRAFEPTGEECGTVYDETAACAKCGAGRQQASDLALDLRKVPRNTDLARTIADEWIVSEPAARIIIDHGLTGVELRPVRHKAIAGFGPMDFTSAPSGRELISRAATAGLSPRDWQFGVWLDRPEQQALFEAFLMEHAAADSSRAARRPVTGRPVYQLVITSPVKAAAPTRFGNDPFDDDPGGEYRCKPCGLAGLAILSELSIARPSWDGSDFAATAQLVGTRRGLLVPAPLVVVSPRVRTLFSEHGLKGAKFEVAHLVPSTT
jgi:hypothetical protein